MFGRKKEALPPQPIFVAPVEEEVKDEVLEDEYVEEEYVEEPQVKQRQVQTTKVQNTPKVQEKTSVNDVLWNQEQRLVELERVIEVLNTRIESLEVENHRIKRFILGG